MVRRVDRQGGVLIWCRKCSGYARQGTGPKLMDCRKPVQVGTTEHGNMLKRIQILEDGRVLAREAKNCRVEKKRGLLGRKTVTV